MMGEALAGRRTEFTVATKFGMKTEGATKPEQLRANVGALRWEPSADDLRELDRIAPPRR